MPYVNTLGLFVRRGSYSSALMAAIAYGHMELKPNITFLRTLPDEMRCIEDAAKELTKVSSLYRGNDEPLYIMTFGITPSVAEALSTDFKLDDVPCVLLPLEARTMPHHDFTPEQIRALGDYFDDVGTEDFVFHVSHRIRAEGDEWDPLKDDEVVKIV